MMQTFTDLADRSNVLWQQRLSLVSSDYVSLSQLRQHDRQLLQSIRLCQRYLKADDAALPLWLKALLDNSAAELNKLLALPLALNAQALLAELCLTLQQKSPEHYSQQYSRPEQSQLMCLLATKPLAAGLYQTMQQLDLRSAVQLAGQTGLTDQLAGLQQLAKANAFCAAGRAELYYSLYVLGQRADESELVTQLRDAQCLTPRQLQLLLLGATTEQKVRIVNALCLADIRLAINAMGYSGLTKFCPLLLDIAKEPAHRAAAQSALITMLGALNADTLQSDGQAGVEWTLAHSNQTVVAGQPLSQLNFAALWVSGNPNQRFAAAALQVLQQPGVMLAEPSNWQGGLWPVV